MAFRVDRKPVKASRGNYFSYLNEIKWITSSQSGNPPIGVNTTSLTMFTNVIFSTLKVRIVSVEILDFTLLDSAGFAKEIDTLSFFMQFSPNYAIFDGISGNVGISKVTNYTVHFINKPANYFRNIFEPNYSGNPNVLLTLGTLNFRTPVNFASGDFLAASMRIGFTEFD